MSGLLRQLNDFADKERLEHLGSVLYNCLDSFPRSNAFDYFYTNPPWGASNNGESVKVFVQRGMEASDMMDRSDSDRRRRGIGLAKQVLANVQQFCIAAEASTSRG